MARSYGSYYKEREKDKPYRTAEIALGFLGDLIAQNNQQSLDYQKLALQEEATQATQEYRKDMLGSKTIDLNGKIMQYNTDTDLYDIQIGGQGAGVQDWGQAYGDRFFNKYLDGQVEYEDTDKNGVIGSKGDRPWVGPAAQLWRDYTTAKVNNEPDFELKHPETIIAAYRESDPTRNEEQAMEAANFLSELGSYQKKIDVYNTLRNIPTGTKESAVRQYFDGADKDFQPKKLTQREVIGIQSQLNTRNKLLGYLAGAKEVTVYSGANANILDDAAPTQALTQSRKQLTKIQMTPEKRNQMKTQIEGIEKFLDSMGIPYSKTITGGTASWVK